MKNYGIALLLGFIALFLTVACEPVEDETPDREKFIGEWTCTEANRKLPAYRVAILEDGQVEENVLLQNFGQLGNQAKPSGQASGNHLTVSPQSCLDDSWQVEGTGVLVTNKRMDWNYKLNDGSTLYDITAVYDRN
ncbi:MAG: hypothetical protein CSA95_03555 [Bacteroidetes bacterium]|nr:MAG: hypothetical protein CSA95_03555 [Bacteroidota bacterium]PIE88488.1 MAG: hypothetical protein CSA04_01700 [Bacteroidota bacterium]